MLLIVVLDINFNLIPPAVSEKKNFYGNKVIYKVRLGFIVF